ncbi:MAG: hypothetical protein CMH54_14100 [Myxococcales bacterium]|nr:hypothetical protein [Myxococcales bacterium]
MRRLATIASLLLMLMIGSIGLAQAAQPAQRIISLAPNTTAIVQELGLGQEIVGVSQFDEVFAKEKGVPMVGGIVDPSVEAIVGLKPSWVVGHADGSAPPYVAHLTNAGIQVALCSIPDLAHLKTCIETLATKLGAGEQGDHLLSRMAPLFEAPDDAWKTGPRTVLLVGDSPLMATTRNSFTAAVARLAGLRPIPEGDGPDYATLSPEAIAELKPDIIVSLVHSHGGGKQHLEESLRVASATFEWVVLSPDDLLQPGPRLLAGFEQLKTVVAKGNPVSAATPSTPSNAPILLFYGLLLLTSFLCVWRAVVASVQSERRFWSALALGFFLLEFLVLLAFVVAPDRIGIWAVLGRADPYATRFVVESTFPRILLAILVGGGLGICGAALQGLLKNPLADPYVLGISGGAAAGGMVATYLALWFGLAGLPSYGVRAIGALIGSLLVTAVLVWAILRRGVRQTERIILLGVALNILAAAVITVVHAVVNPMDSKILLLWLMGALTYLPPGLLLPCVALVLMTICAVIVCRQARALNLLALGEEGAMGAGLDPRRLLWTLLIVCALMTSICGALAGLVGFVGLIGPHIVRLVAGTDNRLVLPLSGLFGASLLLICDILTRVLRSPLGTELPVGAVMAVVGAPVLVFLLIRMGRNDAF